MSNQIKLTTMRKVIAQRMSESWNTAPRVVYTLSVDMTNPKKFVKKMNEGLEDKALKVTFNHLLMKVCAEAMKEYEYINSSFLADKESIEIHDQVNIGLAVALDDGLIVPNTKDVGNKDYKAIAKDCNELVAKAKSNKLTMDDITGGTFTISNLGMMGIENFSPIINLPEAAILGVNKITETPVVEDGEIVTKPLMNLNLVADHRIIDGAYAAKYLSRVKELLESIE